MNDFTWWSASGPWLEVIPNTTETLATIALPPSGLIYSARMAGREMVDPDGVFTQFYEHLLLPEYFGWNWNALRDCLQDLSWISATHFLLTIDDAEFTLSGSPEERVIFHRALTDAAKYWATKPELPGQKKTTFRVILLSSLQASRALAAEFDG
ncbi:barstar family protein [Streptomyces sp. NPDC093060]|uniref:barstar family protein n=1 Tax=Streptomyces sp. NPDC093060 TaxID=3366019 RepID=UPI00381CA9CE